MYPPCFPSLILRSLFETSSKSRTFSIYSSKIEIFNLNYIESGDFSIAENNC